METISVPFSAAYGASAVDAFGSDRVTITGGAVIVIGSGAAVRPQSGLSAYAASKAALVSIVTTIALEAREFGVTANAILPGTMDTPANRTAMPDSDPARWVHPSQVAAMIVHLLSERAAQVSGAVIPILGGEL